MVQSFIDLAAQSHQKMLLGELNEAAELRAERPRFPFEKTLITMFVARHLNEVSRQGFGTPPIGSIDEAIVSRCEVLNIWCTEIDRHRSSDEWIEEFFRYVVLSDGILESQCEFIGLEGPELRCSPTVIRQMPVAKHSPIGVNIDVRH